MKRFTLNPLARGASCVAVTLALLLASSGVARAGDWKWSVTPYAWATDVGVNAKLAGRTVVDETIPVSDLLEDLKTIAQIRLEVQNGAHGLLLDLFTVSLADEMTGVALPQGAGSADLESELGMTILDVAGLYNPGWTPLGFTFEYGIRLIDERAEVDAAIAPATGGSAQQRYEEGETLVDGLIGVRFVTRFAQRFSWQMQADVSAGGTDYTWSAGPQLGYAFGPTGRYALTAGYRHMQIAFEDDVDLESEMTLSGALFGFRMSF